MALEHGEICRQLDKVRSLLASDAGAGRIREALSPLQGLLEEHNVKEEQILYPACDLLLTEQETAELVERLQEAEAPEGWLCRANRIGEA
jgi:iron-sulfur cluster repair protein YtfE (RIC family)